MDQEMKYKLIQNQLQTAMAATEAANRSIEAAFLLLETEIQTVPQGCQHPDEYRRDASTFDKKAFLCMACNKFIEIPGEEEKTNGNP